MTSNTTILGQGPRPGAPGPGGQDMVYTWRVNFILGLNLWNPRYYKLSNIFDIQYIGDYANYVLYTIYHILDILNYRIETRH